ncbi:flagellar motor protein MotB [uncultured Sphingomonas sp.]|uniref:flagellar motor protein MotB n=2 Tax=uncultured Sphingomonas sp. TaxID=158754 RepID=UPI003748DF31
MAAARAPHGNNQPPKIVIVKKIIADGHGGHHGGAWKVAYADFVTAMMAFFLLLWILGATTEKQRKSIADYFTPTIVDIKMQKSAGSNGLFGGSSIIDKDNYPHKAQQTGTRSLTIPSEPSGGNREGTGEKGSLRNPGQTSEDKANFEKMKRQVEQQIAADTKLAKLGRHVRFSMTRDGLRIDLVDDADYSMFATGTTALVPEASTLIGLVADAIRATPNPIMIRGHTDALQFGSRQGMNNWTLSSGRAEATRRRLAMGGVPEARFERIEGVADREPMIADNATDPRNRRVAITLLYRAGKFGE